MSVHQLNLNFPAPVFVSGISDRVHLVLCASSVLPVHQRQLAERLHQLHPGDISTELQPATQHILQVTAIKPISTDFFFLFQTCKTPETLRHWYPQCCEAFQPQLFLECVAGLKCKTGCLFNNEMKLIMKKYGI